jgi:hypothetical protein
MEEKLMRVSTRLARRTGLASIGVSLAFAVGTNTAGAETTSATNHVERTILAPVLQRAIIIVGGLPLEGLVFLNPQPIPPGLDVYPPTPARPLLFPSLSTT